MKRYCFDQRAILGLTQDKSVLVIACSKKKGHKKKHKAVWRWREGYGDKYVDIKVTWSEK